ATGGALGERLGKLLRHPRNESQAQAVALNTEWIAPAAPEEWVRGLLSQDDSEALMLAVGGFAVNGEWAVGMRHGSRIWVEKLGVPYRDFSNREVLERIRPYAAELAIQTWTRWLLQSVN